MGTGPKFSFKSAVLIEERTEIRKRGNTWHVDAHSVRFTVTWGTDGEVTLQQRTKAATTTMTEEELALFLGRIDQDFIVAAFEFFAEIQAELAKAPSPELPADIFDEL